MKGLYLWISSINSIFWHRVVSSTNLNVESLCVFRIITGFVLLAVYHPTFSWIATVPHAFFKPPFLSIAYFFSDLPGRNFFISIDLILLVLNVLIILGVKSKASTLLYTLLSLIGFSYQYSYGKIDHNILLYAMLFCLAFSGWGTKLAIMRDNNLPSYERSGSLALLSVIICFAFFTAGFEKAISWIDFNTDSNGFASWYYYNLYNSGRNFLLAPFIRSVPFASLELIDYATPVFELSPLFFLLISRNAWRSWLCAACVFHIITTLILNISFIWNFIVYLSFINFSALILIKNSAVIHVLYVMSIGILTMLIFRRISDITNYNLSDLVLVPNSFLKPNLMVALLIWTATGFIILRSISKRNLAVKKSAHNINY